MFGDEEESNGSFVLVLGVLASILLVVTVVSKSGGELPTATVSGDTVAETMDVSPTTASPETTAAPATTTPPETTAAPTTTEASVEITTLWDALGESGVANQFMLIGGALGLQTDLEAMVDADGNPIQRTLFAPSDEAIANLDPATIGALTSDPDAAAALVGYHFLDGVVTADGLLDLDGQAVPTRTGLPMNISVVDGNVFLNETSMVTSAGFEADNGIVHIIDLILTPPTVNEVLGLENIEFEVSSATITAGGQEELLKAVAFFAESESVNAVIEGHTDTDGTTEGNLELSQARADAVMAFLVENGIAADRLQAVGFGESQPVLDEAGNEDKVASRRIEFEAR
ncbi:MAG: outer membrane protein OmpA-like peptidoglycan-associated protein [Verrucomicrobiales bacterium]|jgi:outer membrane protein OmpA-like peptidoglycan-associated protein